MVTSTKSLPQAPAIAKLKQLIPRWIKRVPLYQTAAYESALSKKVADGADWLAQFPFISKTDLRRDFPHNFLAADADLDELVETGVVEVEHTSGTSEDRTDLLLPKGWWSSQELLSLKLSPTVAKLLRADASPRRVVINSPVCNNDIKYETLPEYEDRIIGSSLFTCLSRQPFLWDEAELSRMAEETVEWSPQFLDVDPVYAVVFARYCEAKKIRLPNLKFIISSYEYLSVVHRRILERVFEVPVLDLYGATETGHLLMELENGRMVPSTGVGYLELVETDSRGIGELIATTLTNEFMPLIRYRLGDLAERIESGPSTQYLLHGRRQESFTRPDGSRVTLKDIDDCFASASGIIHYQLSQPTAGEWLLRVILDKSRHKADELMAVKKQLRDRLQIKDELKVQPTDLLMPEPSGEIPSPLFCRQPSGLSAITRRCGRWRCASESRIEVVKANLPSAASP